jgi:hypothetical protein
MSVRCGSGARTSWRCFANGTPSKGNKETSVSRGQDLLLAAADALDDGQDPFATPFLSEHNVTLDECYTLGEQLASGARMMVKTMREIDSGGLASQVAAFRLVDALMSVPLQE